MSGFYQHHHHHHFYPFPASQTNPSNLVTLPDQPQSPPTSFELCDKVHWIKPHPHSSPTYSSCPTSTTVSTQSSTASTNSSPSHSSSHHHRHHLSPHINAADANPAWNQIQNSHHYDFQPKHHLHQLTNYSQYPVSQLSPVSLSPVIDERPLSIYRKGSQFGLSLADFDVISTLGTGTFGQVLLVRLISSSTYYAMKVLSKVEIVRLKQVEHMNSEKDLLALVSSSSSSSTNSQPQKGNQFCVGLICTFQDEKNLYMLLEFVQGGELFSHLRRAGRFTADVARFFAANVLLALNGLHELDIVYRDLKPENILLAPNGYVKLTDFGFAKKVPDRTWTLCGTPEYLAPEIIQSKGHGKPADWWAFGVLLYEMLSGFPPFFSPECNGPFGIYEKILACELVFPCHVDLLAQDLIRKLLTPDRSKRLGNLSGGSGDVMNHGWFAGVDWEALANQSIRAPILPKIGVPGDTSNFEKYPAVRLEDLPGIFRAQQHQQLHHHHHHQQHQQPQQHILLADSASDPYGHLFESF